jgi:hypothetical protein
MFPDGTSVYDFGQNASFMPRIRVAGPAGDAEALSRKAAVIRDQFNREFFDSEQLSYGTGSQASLAIPLALGLVDAASAGKQAALDALVRDIESRGYATAGGVGFRSLLQALAGNARSDVVYRMKPFSFDVPLARTRACTRARLKTLCVTLINPAETSLTRPTPVVRP